MSDQKNNNLGTFIAGVIIGAAATYLFGTKSGQKLKDELLKEGSKILEKMGEGLEESQKQLESVGEKVKEETHEVKEKLEEGVHEAEQSISDAAQEIPQHIEEIQKKGRRFFFRRSQTRLES